MTHKLELSDWATCTLCRSHQRSIEVLHRAKTRQPKWTKPKHSSRHASSKDPEKLDKAIGGIMQALSMTSQLCENYHSNHSEDSDDDDQRHYQRFHQISLNRKFREKPVVTENKDGKVDSENVHLYLSPGTYTLKSSATQKERRRPPHVVHIHNKQTFNFVI